MSLSRNLVERETMKEKKRPPEKNMVKKALPTGIWKLETYGTMEDKEWTEVSAEEHVIFLIFRNMCLTLQHGKTLIDHINLLTETVRIIKKHESLGILVVKEKIKTKKLRMKFAPTGLFPGIMMVNQFIEKLKPFVRIEDISFRDQPSAPQSQLCMLQSQKKCDCKTAVQDFWSVATPLTERTSNKKTCNKHDEQDQSSNPIPLSEQISKIFSRRITDFYADNQDLSSLYPVEDVVEACMLDPDFPSFVAQIHDVLAKKVFKK